MRRFSLALLTTCILLSAGTHLWPESLPSTAKAMASKAAPAPPEPSPREPPTESVAARSLQFHDFVNTVVGHLAERRMGLAQASEQVRAYCLSRHPTYLEMVCETEPSTTFRAKLACAVFRLAANTCPSDHGLDVPHAVLTDLAAELVIILLEEELKAAVQG